MKKIIIAIILVVVLIAAIFGIKALTDISRKSNAIDYAKTTATELAGGNFLEKEVLFDKTNNLYNILVIADDTGAEMWLQVFKGEGSHRVVACAYPEDMGFNISIPEDEKLREVQIQTLAMVKGKLEENIIAVSGTVYDAETGIYTVAVTDINKTTVNCEASFDEEGVYIKPLF